MKKANEAIPNTRLQHARKQRNWLQQYVAAEIGTTPVNISRWEQGITNPSLSFRHKLCELFELSSEELGLHIETFHENSASPSKSLPLNGDKVGEPIATPVHKAKMLFTEEEVEWILKQAGHYSLFIQC